MGLWSLLFGAKQKPQEISSPAAPAATVRVIPSISADKLIAEVGPTFEPEARRLILERTKEYPEIPQEVVPEIVELAWDFWKKGGGNRDLGNLIFDRISVRYKKDAAAIAADLMRPPAALLTQRRDEAINIQSYIWRTCRDQRVSPECARLEGKKFRWDKPPEGGHPGFKKGCRCTAEPDIPEIDDLFR